MQKPSTSRYIKIQSVYVTKLNYTCKIVSQTFYHEKDILGFFMCVFFFIFWQRTVKKFHMKLLYMYLKKQKDWKLYTCNYMCDSNKTLLTYVYIFIQRTILIHNGFIFYAPHPFFYIFHKIPFHLKTSEFDVHLFSTPYINALFVSRSYQKAMSNTIVNL